MLRAKNLFLFTLIISGFLFSSDVAYAQNNYTIGPIEIVEDGLTPAEARENAYQAMEYEIAAINLTLPLGHSIVSISIPDEGYLSLLVYFIEFEVLVEVGGGGPGGPLG